MAVAGGFHDVLPLQVQIRISRMSLPVQNQFSVWIAKETVSKQSGEFNRPGLQTTGNSRIAVHLPTTMLPFGRL
jgi:hypothetical protein